MDFTFTDEHLMFRDAVRDLLANECPPAAVRAAGETDAGRIEGLWVQLAEMGVVGLTAPEAQGGLGMNEVDLVLLQEEAGRAVCPEPLIEHTAVALPALVEAGRDDLVADAAAGAITATVGVGPGPYVTAATSADVFVLEAGDALHAVARSDVELTPQTSIDPTRRLAYVDWTPSEDTLLAGASTAGAFDRAALAGAAQALGVGQYLLDETVAYVSERFQFGKPVGSYQAVKHHLANVALALEFARPFVYRAAWCVATADPVQRRDVSAAKALASDAADLAARMALQCHGAIGYTDEYDLQLWLKRAWTLAAAHGDAPWHRRRVADELAI